MEDSKTFKELFKESFITNCMLNEASVTGEELETLEELDSEEVLENFKELMTELLNFKREYKNSDKAELAAKSDQFENLLQKLEGEVRSHISTEHQLHLHIENTQSKVEELEKNYADAQKTIKELQEKLTNSPQVLQENVRINTTKLKTDCSLHKQQIFEAQATINKSRKETKRSDKKNDKRIVGRRIKKRNSTRKSLCDAEVKAITAKRDPNAKRTRPVSRAHIRSNSEYTKILNKRAPSR